MANPLRDPLSGSARNFGGSLRSFFTNLPGAARGARAIGDFGQPLTSPLSPPAPQPVPQAKLSNAFQPMAEPSQSFFGQQQENPVNINYGSLPGIQVTAPSFAAPQARQVPPPPQPMRPPAPQGMDPGVPMNASPLNPPYQQPVQPLNPQFAAAGQLADEIAARRAAGFGAGAVPSPDTVRAAVQNRLDNPPPGTLGGFMQGELSAGTEDGREARRQAMDQSFLSRPMQGGGGISGATPLDRQRRLDMMSPPAMQSTPMQPAGGDVNEQVVMAINAELAKAGVDQAALQAAAEQMNDPRIAQGGRAAISLLPPGTNLSGPGWSVARGADRELTQDDLQRKAKGRVRDQFAPQERMARVRAGRQAMAMNRMAAEQQQYDMATNPLVNPMLLADNPQAMTAAVNAMQDQRRLGFDREQFVEGKDRRAAEVAEIQARTGLTKEMGELQRREFEANEVQRVAVVELTKAEASQKMASAQAIRDESKLNQDRLVMEGDLVGAQAEKTRAEGIASRAEADARTMLAGLETKRFEAEEPMRAAQVGTETARGEAIRQAPILERDRFIAEGPMREAQVGTETARGEAIRQEPILARDQFNAGAGLRAANESLTLAEAQERLAQAGRFSSETAMLTDEKQRQVASIQKTIDSLSSATDPQSIAARNRLVTQQMDILGNQAGIGQPSPLLPPALRQPVAPNPETGRVDTEQVKAKVEQLAAYGIKGPELAAQLEALGVDRASLADFLRNEFRDMRWPRSSGPREYVEAGRSLREVFGIKNDFMGYGR